MLKDKNSAAIVGVDDIERARAFYGDTLGLEAAASDQDDMLAYRTGTTTLTVYQSNDYRPGTGNAIVWSGGGEVEAIATALRGKGVRLEEYPDMEMEIVDGVHRQGAFRAIWFKDPAGNILHVNNM